MKTQSLIALIMIAAEAWGAAQPKDAEITKGPLPSGLVVPARLPDYARWTVTITTGGEDQKTGPPEKEAGRTTISVTKTLPVRLVSTNSPAGDATVWCVGPFQVHQNRTYAKPTLFSRSSQAYIDYSGSDFPELHWLSGKTYVGLMQGKGQPIHVFREKRALLSPEQIVQVRRAAQDHGSTIDESRFFEEREAHIDASTSLPVMCRTGREVHTYRFEQAPTTALEVPAGIKSQIEAERARLTRLARKPPSG